jgi:hypothetical protein
LIELTTESGYKAKVYADYTQVIKDGKTKRFISKNHRFLAVEFILKPQGT